MIPVARHAALQLVFAAFMLVFNLFVENGHVVLVSLLLERYCNAPPFFLVNDRELGPVVVP